MKWYECLNSEARACCIALDKAIYLNKDMVAEGESAEMVKNKFIELLNEATSKVYDVLFWANELCDCQDIIDYREMIAKIIEKIKLEDNPDE